MYMQVIEAEKWKLKSCATSQGARRRKQYYWSQSLAARGQALQASSCVYVRENRRRIEVRRRSEFDIEMEVIEKYWQRIVNIVDRRQRTVSGVVAAKVKVWRRACVKPYGRSLN